MNSKILGWSIGSKKMRMKRKRKRNESLSEIESDKENVSDSLILENKPSFN